MPRLSPKIVLCNSFLYTNNIQKHYSVSRCVISIIIVIAPTIYIYIYIYLLFKISSRIHKYFWSISLNVPIARTCISRHALETSNYNKTITKVNKRVREIVEYKNHGFSETSMPKWQNTSIQEREGKNAQT